MLLTGRHIRLEPLTLHHVDALTTAAAADPAVGDPDLYRWTLVPQGVDAMDRYVRTALEWEHEGTAISFTVVRLADGRVIGSTRFFNMERWAWPEGHPRHGNPHPDAGEIGWTWYARAAAGTGANTEAKYLMLTQAFETWKMLRVCFHTDSRNVRSQAAMKRLGFTREGVLRTHKVASAPEFAIRDSVRFSVLAAEWPEVKAGLAARLGIDQVGTTRAFSELR